MTGPTTAGGGPVDEVAALITRLVGALAPEPVAQVLLDQRFVDDLGYNSVRLVELSFALEDLFQLEPMSVEDAPPIGHVGELVAYVCGKVSESGAPPPTAEAVEEYLRDL